MAPFLCQLEKVIETVAPFLRSERVKSRKSTITILLESRQGVILLIVDMIACCVERLDRKPYRGLHMKLFFPIYLIINAFERRYFSSLFYLFFTLIIFQIDKHWKIVRVSFSSKYLGICYLKWW